MLQIERLPGEGIILGDGGQARIWWIDGRSKVGLDIPAGVSVNRAELWLAKKLEKSGGVILPEMLPIIDAMQEYCPWRLEQVDFKTGRLRK